MTRDIDRVIDYIRGLDYSFGSPVQRQVMIDRLEGNGPPSREELDRARAKVEAASKVQPVSVSSYAIAPHAYAQSEWSTGNACVAMVLRDEYGDQCGYPREHPVHTPVLRTPDEWSALKGIRVRDADGWRAHDRPDWDCPVTEEAFDQMAAQSTVQRL